MAALDEAIRGETPHSGGGAAAALSALWQALLRCLDEATRVIEARRSRRILGQGRLPFVYAVAAFGVAGLAAVCFAGHDFVGGGVPLAHYRGWAAGIMLTTSALAAALAGYLRSQHLWNQERRLRT